MQNIAVRPSHVLRGAAKEPADYAERFAPVLCGQIAAELERCLSGEWEESERLMRVLSIS